MSKKKIIVLVVIGLIVVIGAIGAITEDDTQDSSPAPATTVKRQTAKSVFEDCMDPWDGNYNELEAMIRNVLNDPGSMETHGTYYSSSDSISDGLVTVRLNYSAANAFGGKVRTDAVAEMRLDCSVAEVVTYGF